MGVYIKGMEMPTKENVMVLITSSGDVWMVEGTPDEDTYLVNTKATFVPDHGRLGDLDELEKTFREDADAEWNRFACPANWADAFDDVADMIADAPTVIPAEKASDGL